MEQFEKLFSNCSNFKPPQLKRRLRNLTSVLNQPSQSKISILDLTLLSRFGFPIGNPLRVIERKCAKLRAFVQGSAIAPNKIHLRRKPSSKYNYACDEIYNS